MKPTRWRRRGVGLYLTTVSVSIILAGMAWSMIATQRADRRLQSNIDLENQAYWAARGAVEIGLAYPEQVPTWRSQPTSILSGASIADASCDVRIIDEGDGSLSDDETDAARLFATATLKGSTYKLQASLTPRPHPALGYACFGPTNENMAFMTLASVRGPVRSHGNITSSAGTKVSDDASFETMSGYTIGSKLTPSQFTSTPIAPPSGNLAWYLAQATPISGTTGPDCQIQGYSLTPTYNPTGVANPAGIYSLDPGGRDVYINNLYLRGTLIIHNAPGRSITFTRGLSIQPGPFNYPVLMLANTDGNADISPNLFQLSEATSQLVLNVMGSNVTVSSSVDFNQDGDTVDVFPTMINGIIWTSSQHLHLNTGNWPFVGSAISRGIVVDNSVSVDNDAQLQNTLCPGFIGTGMRLMAGSLIDIP